MSEYEEELPDYIPCPKCEGEAACDCDYCSGQGKV